MTEQGQFLAAVEPSQSVFDMFDFNTLKVGDTVTAREDLRFRLRKVKTKDGREWLAVFTSSEEMNKGESTSMLAISMENHMQAVLNMDAAGLIINPWDKAFLLDKDLIRIILKAKEADDYE